MPLPAARRIAAACSAWSGSGWSGSPSGSGPPWPRTGSEEAPTAPPRSSASTCRPASPRGPDPGRGHGVRAGARRVGPGGRAARFLEAGRPATPPPPTACSTRRAGSGTRRWPASSVPRPTGPWSRPCGSGASADRGGQGRRHRHPLPPGGHRPVRRAGPRPDGRGVAGQPPGRPLAGRGRPGVGPCRPARRRPRPRGGDRLGPAPARLRPPGRPACRSGPSCTGRPTWPGCPARSGAAGRWPTPRASTPPSSRRPMSPSARGRLLGPAGAGPGPAHPIPRRCRPAGRRLARARHRSRQGPMRGGPETVRPCPVPSVLPRRISCPSSASS